jgi:hypothetical protein
VSKASDSITTPALSRDPCRGFSLESDDDWFNCTLKRFRDYTTELHLPHSGAPKGTPVQERFHFRHLLHGLSIALDSGGSDDDISKVARAPGVSRIWPVVSSTMITAIDVQTSPMSLIPS